MDPISLLIGAMVLSGFLTKVVQTGRTDRAYAAQGMLSPAAQVRLERLKKAGYSAYGEAGPRRHPDDPVPAETRYRLRDMTRDMWLDAVEDMRAKQIEKRKNRKAEPAAGQGAKPSLWRRWQARFDRAVDKAGSWVGGSRVPPSSKNPEPASAKKPAFRPSEDTTPPGPPTDPVVHGPWFWQCRHCKVRKTGFESEEAAAKAWEQHWCDIPQDTAEQPAKPQNHNPDIENTVNPSPEWRWNCSRCGYESHGYPSREAAEADGSIHACPDTKESENIYNDGGNDMTAPTMTPTGEATGVVSGTEQAKAIRLQMVAIAEGLIVQLHNMKKAVETLENSAIDMQMDQGTMGHIARTSESLSALLAAINAGGEEVTAAMTQTEAAFSKHLPGVEFSASVGGMAKNSAYNGN